MPEAHVTATTSSVHLLVNAQWTADNAAPAASALVDVPPGDTLVTRERDDVVKAPPIDHAEVAQSDAFATWTTVEHSFGAVVTPPARPPWITLGAYVTSPVRYTAIRVKIPI